MKRRGGDSLALRNHVKVATSMAILLTVATLLLCIPTPPVSNESAVSKQRDVATQQTKNEPTPSVSAESESHSTGEHAQLAEPKAEAAKGDTYDAKTDILYRWYLRATIFGVIGGFLALGFIWRQTKLTKSAAEAAQTAAIAAQNSAQAVVNAERAWVMVDVRFTPGVHLGILRSADGIVRTRAKMEVSLQNCGPTPAWVFEQFICLRVSNFVVMSKTEYPSPQFPHVGDGKVSHANYSILPMVQGQEPATWIADIWDEGWATEDNGLYVHIFGVVRYRDAFSLLRETYFGYSVFNGVLERMPSEAYNKHT